MDLCNLALLTQKGNKLIRHVVVFTLKPDAPRNAVASAIENAKNALPSIQGVRSFSIGEDLGLQPGKSGDMAVVAEFDSIDAVTSYLEDPIHLDYIKNNLAAIVESRISVQFAV